MGEPGRDEEGRKSENCGEGRKIHGQVGRVKSQSGSGGEGMTQGGSQEGVLGREKIEES